MKYQEYIDLGFERIEMNCSIELKRTGYYGFVLAKKLNPSCCIEVVSGELNEPKLYINKDKGVSCHILPLNKEQILELLK